MSHRTERKQSILPCTLDSTHELIITLRLRCHLCLQEQVTSGGEHWHVCKCQRDQRHCEHEHVVVEHNLWEQRVQEERGYQSESVKRKLREQVLEAWHRHERQHQVQDHGERPM